MTYTDGHSKKSCSNPNKGPLQPFFRNKKPQVPYLQTHVFLPHLSSSSDLRIVSSHTAFSGFPNDRLSSSCRCLHAYSGGTVRDSHPVFYSPAGLLPLPQALKRNIYLRIYDTRLRCNCQSKKGKSIEFDTNRNLIQKKRKIVGSTVYLDNPLHG